MGQVQKARDIAEEFGHDGIVECLTLVLKSCCSLVSRGGGDDEEEGEEGEKPAFNEENKNILEKLDKGADPEGMHICSLMLVSLVPKPKLSCLWLVKHQKSWARPTKIDWEGETDGVIDGETDGETGEGKTNVTHVLFPE